MRSKIDRTLFICISPVRFAHDPTRIYSSYRALGTIRFMPRNLYLLTAYDGTDFHGWQRQAGDLRTVQGVLEDALRRVLRHPVDLICSGRTDAGVHAAGHVVSFSTTHHLPPPALQQALCSRLPPDLAILEVKEVLPAFHATRSATSKLYRYRIHAGEVRPVKNFTQRYTYHCWIPLDLERMQAGATCFVGERDFSAMTPVYTVRQSFVRRVFRCDATRAGDEIHIEVEGDGFLYHQVRNMVGTLIEVARGRWRPEEVTSILESRDRRRAGQTAPAHGLCLQWVRYPMELLTPPPTSVNSESTWMEPT